MKNIPQNGILNCIFIWDNFLYNSLLQCWQQ